MESRQIESGVEPFEPAAENFFDKGMLIMPPIQSSIMVRTVSNFKSEILFISGIYNPQFESCDLHMFSPDHAFR